MNATLIIVGFVAGVCILACAFLVAFLLQHRRHGYDRLP